MPFLDRIVYAELAVHNSNLIIWFGAELKSKKKTFLRRNRNLQIPRRQINGEQKRSHGFWLLRNRCTLCKFRSSELMTICCLGEIKIGTTTQFVRNHLAWITISIYLTVDTRHTFYVVASNMRKLSARARVWIRFTGFPAPGHQTLRFFSAFYCSNFELTTKMLIYGRRGNKKQ